MSTKFPTHSRRYLHRLFVASVLFVYSLLATAAPAKLNTSVSYWAGVEYDSGKMAINRLSLSSDLKKRWGRRWQLDVEASVDWANDETGLGSTAAYAPLSSPFVRTEHFRAQIERATLRYRHKAFSATVGKQVLAWGVLDGLRIADRADPVRLRDFVLAERRPERLGRWGLRVRSKLGKTALDVAALFDNTGDQAPTLGGAFFPTATRSLGGIQSTSLMGISELNVESRTHALSQTTWALKLARRVGAFDVQVIGLHGPDTQPVIVPRSASEIALAYPTRSLAAVSVQRALGPAVIRFESAYIPDQRVNLSSPGQQEEVGRLLAGVGVDFRPGGRWFVNAQLGLDQLDRGESSYARPRTDLIGTLRMQRNYVQDRLLFKAELIGSLRDGDGYLGTSLAWQFNDAFKAAIGSDVLFGNQDRLFGQFNQRSRGWLRLTYVL